MIRLNAKLLAATLMTVSGMFMPPADAAQLAGVSLPNRETLGSQTLVLNGIGLRTFSVLHVHVYVAGLYLPYPMGDANAILQSSAPKILRLHFVHDVSLSKVQQTWKKGLIDNCVAPCELSNAELNQFLASLRPVSAGEDIMLIFDKQGLAAYENGQSIGRIDDPQFAQLMLAVFIGPHVDTPELKSELLGLSAGQSS